MHGALAEAASITEGRVFRVVLRGPGCQRSLRLESLSKAVKKLAARIEMDPKTNPAHSPRAGFVSTCVETNAPLNGYIGSRFAGADYRCPEASCCLVLQTKPPQPIFRAMRFPCQRGTAK